MLRYGVPYKGSKNKIAEWVVSQFPSKTHFYDLFAGGCAVTHAALLSGKFKHFLANDITDTPRLFYDAIHGKFHCESRWISRGDFYRLKDSEPYVRYVWSFGNNGRAYLYSKEVEPWKKALHYARVFNDFSLLREFGICTRDASRINVKKNMDAWKKKYIAWYCHEVLHSSLDVPEMTENLKERVEHNSEVLRNYLIEGLKKSGKRPCDVDRFLETNGMAGHYFGKSQWEFPTREVYIKLQGFLYLPQNYEEVYGLQELYDYLQRLESLERLQRLQSLESLERLERLQRLEISRMSYDEVPILPDSVIYCDIPYRNTDGYGDGKENTFDYEKFYSWCERQTEPCFISEYDMPEDRFVAVSSVQKLCTLASSSNSLMTEEKIFIPKTQVEMFRALYPELLPPELRLAA